MKQPYFKLTIFLFLAILLNSFTIDTSSYLQTKELDSQKQFKVQSQTQSHQELQTTQIYKRLLQTLPVPINLTTTSVANYQGIKLNYILPTSFTIGERFEVRGTLTTTAGASGTYVNMMFLLKSNTTTKVSFQTYVNTGQTAFIIILDTNKIPAGDYILAFFSGNSISNIPFTPVYTILSKSTDTNAVTPLTAPSKPTLFKINFANNKLFFTWNEDNKTPIEKITFAQTGATTLQYILTNFQSKFQVPFKDFAKFKVGVNVTVLLYSALSTKLSLSGRCSPYSAYAKLVFMPGNHHFTEQSSSLTLINQIPWIVATGSVVQIKGKCTKNVNNRIVAEQPLFTIGKYSFLPSPATQVNAGVTFDANITMSKQGVYILEVNDMSGGAVLNRPVYVGTFYPLIPDFADLSPSISMQQIIDGQPQTSLTQRALLLSLVNKKRTLWGRTNLTEDTVLDTLAQSHSDDMVARNFFGHVNPSGKGPQQRATDMGITYSVGENIAMNLNLTQAHLRLCRSPGHLSNIVEGQYERIGFGVKKNTQGYLYVTQNFASRDMAKNPLTTTQLADITTNVTSWIQLSYTSVKTLNSTASQKLSSWMATNRSQSLIDFILATKLFGSFAYSMVTVSWSKSFMTQFANNVGSWLKPYDTTYTKFGIGVKQTSSGQVQIYVLYFK